MISNTIYIPFTYCITFLLTGEKYYGVRYAKKCHPSQLWDTYFTSSTKIHDLISMYGKSAFSFEVRKIFTTKEEACAYEHRFLTKINAATNPKWLNSSNGAGTFHCTKESSKKAGYKHRGKTVSNTTRQKISNATKGRVSSKKGKPISIETRQKISAGGLGIPKPPKILSCPYCLSTIKGASNAKRWHFDNCKNNPLYIKPMQIQKLVFTCPHCNLSSNNRLNMQRWHFDNCKSK